MRRKFFIAQNTKRIAYCLLSVVAVFVTCIGIFYVQNQTLPYYQSLESNKRLAQRVTGIQSEEAYFERVNRGDNYLKRANLQRAYTIATSVGIIGSPKMSIGQIKSFVSNLEDPSISMEPNESVFEQDRIANNLTTLASAILKKSDELEYSNPAEFELKKRVYNQLSKICTSMDGHGTYGGVLNRANTASKIFERIYDFQKNTAASSDLKDQLIESTIPTLNKPFDLKFMFQFEYLRAQTMIDALNGTAKISQDSQIFQHSKPLNLAQRLMLKIPGVAEAWESKFNKSLSKVMLRFEPDPKMPYRTDNINLILALKDSNSDHRNAGYLDHFGYTNMVQSMSFNHNDWYTWHILDQQKKDHQIQFTSN